MLSGKSKTVLTLALLPALALGACSVAPPTHPTVLALPGQGKSFTQFQQDDGYCQSYASYKTNDAGQVAANSQNNSVATAGAGAVIGALVGAGLGSLSGNVGNGAALGAGAGLIGGASVAGDNAAAAANSLQGRYDVAYAQCMVGHGETIQPPGGGGYGPPPGYYAPPPGYGYAPY